MSCSNNNSLGLRIGQFVCAAIVLGISAFFLTSYHPGNLPELSGTFVQELASIFTGAWIYTAVVAALSLIVSLLFMVQTKVDTQHPVAAMIFALAYLAAGGLLIITHFNHLDRMSAVCVVCEFLAAILWLVSFVEDMRAYKRRVDEEKRDGNRARS